ncbi:ComEC/Rec2 family competence protein [Pseudomonas syringae]|uniref:ComEC/Rec2 family competence protein n=1 Tax=Pseudomonas syringae TaxID=317 RepID=UPI003204A7A3
MSKLTVLDVGHGNCAVLSSEDINVVVDAANRTHLLCYLELNSITVIDLIVISHTDLDHVGGLINVLCSPEVVVKRLVINPDSQKKSKIWGDIRALIDDKVMSGALDLIMSVHSGKTYGWAVISESLKLEVISPTVTMALGGPGLRLPAGSQKVTSNSASIVIRVIYNNKPVALITGDMDMIALSEIRRLGTSIKAQNLVFPHHGGMPGNADPIEFTRSLMDMVCPEFVLFSNGRGLHGTPKLEIIQTIRAVSPAPYIACTQLSENCCEAPLAREDYIPLIYSAGADDDSFCAGTVQIDLDTGLPNQEGHAAHSVFTGGLPKRLCGRI